MEVTGDREGHFAHEVINCCGDVLQTGPRALPRQMRTDCLFTPRTDCSQRLEAKRSCRSSGLMRVGKDLAQCVGRIGRAFDFFPPSFQAVQSIRKNGKEPGAELIKLALKDLVGGHLKWVTSTGAPAFLEVFEKRYLLGHWQLKDLRLAVFLSIGDRTIQGIHRCTAGAKQTKPLWLAHVDLDVQ